MRFNEKNSMISCLDAGFLNVNLRVIKKAWPYERCKHFLMEINDTFVKYKDEFSKNIQYITEPFHNAYEKAQKKIAEVVLTESISQSGTFIYRGGKVTTTIFYWYQKSEDLKTDGYIYFCYLEFAKMENKDEFILMSAGITTSETIQEFWSDVYPDRLINVEVISQIMMLSTFISFCEKEVKVLEPKEKYRNASKVRFYNETKQKIKILDSRWFTELIVSGAFKVGGHFRLQPYGTNRSERKLIWISDYEKKGYHRKALKDIQS